MTEKTGHGSSVSIYSELKIYA